MISKQCPRTRVVTPSGHRVIECGVYPAAGASQHPSEKSARRCSTGPLLWWVVRPNAELLRKCSRIHCTPRSRGRADAHHGRAEVYDEAMFVVCELGPESARRANDSVKPTYSGSNYVREDKDRNESVGLRLRCERGAPVMKARVRAGVVMTSS